MQEARQTPSLPPPSTQPQEIQIIRRVRKSNMQVVKVVLYVCGYSLRSALSNISIPGFLMVAFYTIYKLYPAEAIDDVFVLVYYGMFTLGWRFSTTMLVMSVHYYLFTAEMSKKAIYLFSFPLYFITVAPMALESLSFGTQTMLGNALLVFYLFGIYSHKFNTNQPNDSPVRRAYNILIRDGTPSAISKGIFVMMASLWAFWGVLSIYLKSEFLVQLAMRFVVFGIMFTLLWGFQQYLVTHLAPEYTGRRLKVLSEVNFSILVLKRLMISTVNSSTVTDAFLLINVFNAISEIIVRSLYMQGYALFQYFRVKVSQMSSLCLCCRKAQTRVVQVQPAEFEGPQQDQVRYDRQAGYLSLLINPVPPPPEARFYRARQIIDFMDAEIRAIILVPILLYLAKPLFPNSYIQMTSSSSNMLHDILVQILTQLACNAISLFIEIRYLRIPVTVDLMKSIQPCFLDFATTLFAGFFIHSRFLVSVNYETPNRSDAWD